MTKEYATTTSTGMPAYFARKGWGTCVTGDTSQKFTPGDVVSKSGHVWIVIGQCSDGSVVVIHATPPYIQAEPFLQQEALTVKLLSWQMNT